MKPETLSCVAIDDEPLALELMESFIGQNENLNLVASFEDAISGAEYLSYKPVDLLFLDIDMPDISGIELVKSMEKKPLIIFVTAHKQFAFDGYELEAVDYLLKPVDPERLNKAVERAMEMRNLKSPTIIQRSENFIFISSEHRLIKVNLDDITYIQSMSDYLKIYLSNGEVILTLMSMKKIMTILPEENFVRIHRSYIVPLSRIRSVHDKKVELKGMILPLSNTFAGELQQRIKKI